MNQVSVKAFRQGLRELGYIEGQNIVIEWRFAKGERKRLPGLAAELVKLKGSRWPNPKREFQSFSYDFKY